MTVPLTLLAGGFLLPSRYEDTFLGELKYKCRRLEETEGRRIVFVGGSAVAFGIDSSLVERELPGFTAVNFGMYAALGTRIMLDLSEGSLREGDIVILCPEQQEQTLSGYLGADYLWQGVDGEFSLLTRVSRKDAAVMVGTFPVFAASKLRGYFAGEEVGTDGVYSRKSFDAYGDMISPLCDANVMPGGYDPNMPVRFQPDMLTGDFVDAVNDYVDNLAHRGVAVWYHACPMNALAVENGSDVDGYYDSLQARLHCPVAGDPSDSILDAAWFYDTNFHLNAAGKSVFTYQMIRDIKAMLGDSSPTQFAMPEQPRLETQAVYEGSNEDGDCFTYVLEGDTAVITGLTAEGAVRSELTVPFSWQGHPIEVLSAEVFSQNGTVVSITLQSNIRRIEDKAFDGCTALRALILMQEEPECCSVGTELLTGTDALIYVPEAAATAYKLNYFWSPYAGKIRESHTDGM